MADRSLRGMSIGAKSMESDEGVDFAPASRRTTTAPTGTPSSCRSRPTPRSPGVGVPLRRRGAAARRGAPEPKAGKPARTHWDMLLERRTISELEELLDERLGLLRAGKLRRSA